MGRVIPAQDVIDFINDYLRVPEGRVVGQKMELRDWQQDLLRAIYDNPHGTRQAIISFGRKNGKTAITAMLVLAHLVGPKALRNSSIFSAAQSRDQASLVFDYARKMVRLSPKLNELIVTRDARKELFCGLTGVTYRALSADADTGLGLSPVLVVHDELGRVKGPRSPLYDALETATGAHESPLSIIISTQAPTDGDLLSILISDAQQGHDPRTVLSLHTAPLDMDPFCDEAIRLANPAFGDFLNADEVRTMAANAMRMPSAENSYRNLVLNQRVSPTSPFVSVSTWDACGAMPVPLDGVPVFGGLDLSEVADLTALTLVGNVGGIWQTHPTFWLPEDGLLERSRKDRVPYDLWAKQGHLQTAPGKTVDYSFVAHHLAEILKRYDIRAIAFDRWGFERNLRPALLRAGIPEDVIAAKFVEFGQGTKSMSPALNALEAELLNARIAHGNHPLLKMCSLNAIVVKDAAGNRKLDKAKSTGRIDGMVALAMAISAAQPVEEDVWAMDRIIRERGGLP
jgi:phage terminase large subunit-like protein